MPSTSHRIGVALALTLPLAGAASTQAPNDTPAQVRAAVKKALPLMQRSAEIWNERRPCASCHHHVLGSMAVQLAREHGFPIDEPLLAREIARMRFRTREPGLLDDAGINIPVAMSYIIVGLGVAKVPADGVTDARFHVISG